MALIQCPECGKEISDQAASCPHCGRPLRTEVWRHWINHIFDKRVLLVASILFVLYLLVFEDHDRRTAAENTIHHTWLPQVSDVDTFSLASRFYNRLRVCDYWQLSTQPPIIGCKSRDIPKSVSPWEAFAGVPDALWYTISTSFSKGPLATTIFIPECLVALIILFILADRLWVYDEKKSTRVFKPEYISWVPAMIAVALFMAGIVALVAKGVLLAILICLNWLLLAYPVIYGTYSAFERREQLAKITKRTYALIRLGTKG
ncbi:MAG TPA: zinc ribbon domain-containing protein [Ktedonobacteraceae bacterium]